MFATRARTFAIAAGVGLGLAPAILAALGAAPARAEALLLVDLESGNVISQQNATAPWYPASVTKLMTAYVTLKALQDHRLTRESLFVVSPRAVSQQPAKMGFKAGTRLTVDNALKMMLVHSANDMAIVLAEGVSGSIDKFTAQMNAEAQRLGMTQTSYVNPNGLPDERQITSARDLAILARALLRDFPEYDDYWHIASIRLGRHIYHNTNKLIDAYAGSDGMKTGFICASGYNLVATASKGGKRLIAVVLGARTDNARVIDAAGLLERGFAIDPLSWAKSPVEVNALEPVAATPPDMHDEVCPTDHRHHRPPPTDSGEEAAAATTDATSKAMSLGDLPLPSLSLPSLPTTMPAARLTPGLTASLAPIEVYTGPARPPGWVPPAAATGKKKKKSSAIAAKPPAQSATPRAAAPAAKPAKPNSGPKPAQWPEAVPALAAPPADGR